MQTLPSSQATSFKLVEYNLPPSILYLVRMNDRKSKGKLFKQNFLYVFIQRTIFTREKASSNPVLFSRRPFPMLLFPFFSPETPVFHLDAYSTIHRKTLTHILPFGRCKLCVFLHDNYIALTGIFKRGSYVSYLGRRFFKFLSFSACFLKLELYICFQCYVHRRHLSTISRHSIFRHAI